MYEEFFGFRERPFDLTPNPRFLVLTESHREALSNLEYGIASRKGITLLIGEAGSGKTTVIRAAIEKQPGRVHCVHLHNPTLSREEFVEMLATRFGLSERALRSKTSMLLELEALLTEPPGRTARRRVLVVDEAQSLPLDLLEEIRLLANIETNDREAAVGDHRRAAGAGRPAERPSAAPVQAARRAAVRVAAADAAGNGRVHRRTHPRGRRRRRRRCSRARPWR